MEAHAKALEILAEVLKASQHMHSLAQAGSWDEFEQQEKDRQKSVAELQRLLGSQPYQPTPSSKAKADSIIARILALDGETRMLVERQMADIAESFSSVGVSRQLNSVYLRP